MEACEVVRLFINKAVVSAEPTRRGNPGYGRLKAIRILVYSKLKRLENEHPHNTNSKHSPIKNCANTRKPS